MKKAILYLWTLCSIMLFMQCDKDEQEDELPAIEFEVIATNTPWSYGKSSAVFNNKMWVLSESLVGSAIYKSEDGQNWIPIEGTESINRLKGKIISFNNELWMVGGTTLTGHDVDIVKSSDGQTWEVVHSEAPWGTGRTDLALAVYHNKLWVIGGKGDDQYFNDIWNSEDGQTWTKVLDNALNKHYGHQAYVFDGLLWVVGGYSGNNEIKNTIWNSEDGISWSELDYSTEGTGTDFLGYDLEPFFRYRNSVVVHQGKVWCFGGAVANGGNAGLNDIWCSEDGRHWKQIREDIKDDEFIRGRFEHSTLSFQEKIWVIGGRGRVSGGFLQNVVSCTVD